MCHDPSRVSISKDADQLWMLYLDAYDKFYSKAITSECFLEISNAFTLACNAIESSIYQMKAAFKKHNS
jgi:hypothetical protein